MNDQQIEKEIVEKGKTAPRITPQHIEDVIKSEHYFTAYDGRNGAISATNIVAGKNQKKAIVIYHH